MKLEHLRLPEADSGEILWAVAAGIALVLIPLVLYLLANWRKKRKARRIRSFDPGTVVAELARLNPGRAQVTVIRDRQEAKVRENLGEAPFLKRDGKLLEKNGCFFMGRPDAVKAAGSSALRGKGETVEIEFLQRGVRQHLQGQVLSRKRLSRRAKQAIDFPEVEYSKIEPVGALEKDELREVMRYYLQEPEGEDVEICHYVSVELYANRTDCHWPADESPPVEVQQVKLYPHRGTAECKQAPGDSTVVDKVRGDLLKLREATVWAARLGEDGRDLGQAVVLELEQSEKKQQLKLEFDQPPSLDDEDPEALRADDLLMLGYAAGDLRKEFIARVAGCSGRYCRLVPRTLPRAEGGYRVEVIDFSTTGAGLEADPGLLSFLLGEEDAVDAQEALERLRNAGIALCFYPEFRFPAKGEDYLPAVPGKFWLIGRLTRIEPKNGRLDMGIRFLYEPETWDPLTGLPEKWRLLHGNRESRQFTEIHRAVNQLRGFLESDALEPASAPV